VIAAHCDDVAFIEKGDFFEFLYLVRMNRNGGICIPVEQITCGVIVANPRSKDKWNSRRALLQRGHE